MFYTSFNDIFSRVGFFQPRKFIRGFFMANLWCSILTPTRFRWSDLRFKFLDVENSSVKLYGKFMASPKIDILLTIHCWPWHPRTNKRTIFSYDPPYGWGNNKSYFWQAFIWYKTHYIVLLGIISFPILYVGASGRPLMPRCMHFVCSLFFQSLYTCRYRLWLFWQWARTHTTTNTYRR